MLKKPDFTPQEQEIDQKAPINNVLQAKQEGKIVNNGENTVVTAPSLVNESPQDKMLLIRNKRAYNSFKSMVKRGKFTNAVISSKLLGVTRQTIVSWLNTKPIIEAMNEDVNKYISTIASSKDWKAQAYLLDKVIDNDKNTSEHTTTLNNLIQINI